LHGLATAWWGPTEYSKSESCCVTKQRVTLNADILSCIDISNKVSQLQAYTNGMSGIEVPITKMKMLSTFKSSTHYSDENASDVLERFVIQK
jgi:hypothetical protein